MTPHPVSTLLASALLLGGCVLEDALPPAPPVETDLRVQTTVTAELGDGRQRVTDDTVGASVVVPANLHVENEGMTLEDSYGFTLWSPPTDGDDSAHSQDPLLRVSLAYKLTPAQIPGVVSERLAELAELSPTSEPVSVGPMGLAGTSVGPIPGSTPYHEVYVPLAERVYRVQVFSEVLDDAARQLLAAVELQAPTVPLESLNVVDANSDEALDAVGDDALVEAESADRTGDGQELQASDLPDRNEDLLNDGCFEAPTQFYVQTQQGKYANRHSYPGRRPGWMKIGLPNFWGEYTHGNIGMGRCSSVWYTNDKYAIDYPLERGDAIFSPFRQATVTFAGRATSHKNYGIFVTLRAAGGKYYNVSIHLTRVRRGIRRGKDVTKDTVIGFAGNTGGNIAVGPVHLHQAFYRYPRLHRNGTPYAGRGLKVVYHRYWGHAAGNNGGVYKFGWNSSGIEKSKGDWISN